MRVTAKGAALILPLFFILGIGSAMISGYWRTESSKQPARYTEGELAGEYNPADIRGSYSFGDIEEAFGIPVETLAKAFGFSSEENPGGVQIKIFEEIYGSSEEGEIGTDSMRLFVSIYLNRPYIPEEDTLIPQPAFNILKKEGKVSAEDLAEFEDKVISLETLQIEKDTGTADVEVHEEVLMEIKGKTTFAELLDCGLRREQIEDVLGMPMGQTSVSVRDYCMEKGVEFSTVKSAIQEMLDK